MKNTLLDERSYFNYAYAIENENPNSWMQKPNPLVSTFFLKIPHTDSLLVLDIGCGSGRHSLNLARILSNRGTGKVIAIDYLPLAIELLKEKAKAENLSDYIQASVDSVENFNYERRFYNFVLAHGVLQHISSNALFHQILTRVLDSVAFGGIVFIVMHVDQVVTIHGHDHPVSTGVTHTSVEITSILTSACSVGWKIESCVETPFLGETIINDELVPLRATQITFIASRLHNI